MNKGIDAVRISRIVSGGQAGADRAAFDFALEKGIEIGGFVPPGRQAEDGPIDDKYLNLVETSSSDPDERTRLNVRSADATLIVSRGPVAGGSKYTGECAHEMGRPLLQIDLQETPRQCAAVAVREWLIENNVRVLNVAGPRAFEDPGIYLAVRDLLRLVWEFK